VVIANLFGYCKKVSNNLAKLKQNVPEHTKECEYRITHGIRHDNCFCECHDKGKYHGSSEPKDRARMTIQ